MSIVFQSKGLQHCRDIKRDAMTFWYLYGGAVKDFNECIKIALKDHRDLLREEATITGRVIGADPPTESGEGDPF
jgi:hypothetical protein